MAKKTDYPVFEPFNPLDKRHLGASVANALLESDIYGCRRSLSSVLEYMHYIMLEIFLHTRYLQKLTATTSSPAPSM